MPAVKAKFRGHVYSHQQMEALIRALVFAGIEVSQTAHANGKHDCRLAPNQMHVGRVSAMLISTRWKALAAAVTALEQP